MPSGWMVKMRFNPKKNVDGVSEMLFWGGFWNPQGQKFLFRTKRECKAHIDRYWGYIKARKDLREYPHGWLLPVPVRVNITAKEVVE